jgi:sugar phosphate isomerase/epimerase
MGLAISTSWNAWRHEEGKGLLFEIRALGFEEAELSFNLTSSMVKDVQLASGKDVPKIISVHNYCPIPADISRQEALPDVYSLSSLDEAERRLALKHTKETIHTASCLGARAVVLHCGRVEIPDKTRELIELYAKGASSFAEFRELKARLIQEREKNYRPFLEQTLRSLEELASAAEEKNILLGIETRFYYREIPSPEEIRIILDKLKGAPVYYWHDTGHAQVMENLSFFRHRDLLDAYGERMIGIHLHDITGCQDHQAPLTGEFDFSILRPYLKKETLKIIEAHEPATAAKLKLAKRYLEGLFYGED